MLKIEKNKNHDNIEFDTINISDLIVVDRVMFDRNEKHWESNFEKYIGNCQQCGKGIKVYKNSFGIICNGNTETIVRRSHYEISVNSGGGMGCWDIGPECAKRIKKALKEIGEDWKDWLAFYKENN